MKQFLRHIYLLVALFVASTSLTAQTYNGGTWYSLYETGERTLSTIDSETLNAFTPVGTNLTFDAKKQTLGANSLRIAPIVNGSQQSNIFENGLSTSYKSYSATVSNPNSNQIKFYTVTGATLKKYFKNVKLPLAKHILLNDNTSNGQTWGVSSITLTDNSLATAEGKTSTSAYTIRFRSFLASGNITIKSNNSEFHFGNGATSISLNTANNYFARIGGTASKSSTNPADHRNVNEYETKVYFSPAVQYNKNTRSTTITISDGTNTAYIYLSAPVIPTYFFKAEAISYPAEGGTATATFANGQSTYSIIAPDYATSSVSTTATFTAAPKTAEGYVFEGWKKDPANATFHEQGAGKTTITETITSSALNPNGLASQLTLYAIYSHRYTAKITGSNYTNKLVNDSLKADYQFINTQTAIPTNSEADPFYFKIEHNFTGNDTREGSTRPNEVIAYDPTTNTITALNEGTATITFYQKNTSSHEPVTESFTVQVIKHTPKFTWNANNITYYYGTSIPNIFSTTNPDVETTFTSDNEAFARVENNTLYIANARETATITVSQQENYKWYGNTEQYPISPVNADNHVPFKIDSEAKYNSFRQSTSHKCSWSGNRINFYTADWSDKYYDIHFEGIPDVVTFDYDADWAASDIEWFVQESSDGINWSDKLGRSTNNSGSTSVTLQSSTHYLRFCYSGNLNGYISNIDVTERFQFEATPTAIDFGSEGINHGQQKEKITFLHANAGRITKATIIGDDAKYFTVTPEFIPGTGRDCFGNAELEVTFDNLGEDRGATPYNATLVISDNSDKTEDIYIPLTGIRDGKSTADIIWNPNALPYYFNTTIANIAYSTNKDANCPLTFTTSDTKIAEVKGSDLYIYDKGQEVTITVTQPGNADYMPATETFTFTPCERPSLEVPFRVSQALHAKSVQLGTKSGWYENDNQIRIASTSIGDGFIWGDDRKRVLITFAGVPDKLYFEYSSSNAATTESLQYGWEVEESVNGTDWNTVWKTGSLSASWKSSGEIDLNPNTQYIRFSYKGNFAGYLRNIIISSLEGNNYLRAEEGSYLSRGAKWGTQAVVDPFGMVCRVSHFTVDNTNIYTRLQFVDNMQYLYETADTKEVFTDAEHANNSAYLWQINSDASGKFTVQSANNLDNGNHGNYFTLIDNTLAFTSDPALATIWHMETPAEHNNVVKSYMDAAAAKAAEKDFGSDINTLEKVRSSLNREDFEITEVDVPAVALAEQTGEYRDGINGTLAVYDTIISGLKPGFYRLTVKALYRISDSQKAQAAKTNGWESVLAYVYANDVKYPIQSVYTSYNAGSYDASDEIYGGHPYPTKLNPSVAQAFSQDVNRYLNDVYVYVEADPGQTTGTLHYGIKNPSYVPGAWLAYSTVTLTHFGRKEYIFQGDNSDDWDTPSNWNRNAVPDLYHNVRIKADVNISTPVNVYGMRIDEGLCVHITSTGGINVGSGGVISVATDVPNIIIDNDLRGAGFLCIDPSAEDKSPKVQVNYTTRAKSGDANEQVWQYVGTPGENPVMSSTENAKIYYWSETEGWVKHSADFDPFKGYAISQKNNANDVYTIAVTPILANHTIELTKTLDGMNGDNLFVNSYLAPIDLTTFTDFDDALNNPNDDFKGDFEKTFYLFNSGSLKDCYDNGGKGNEQLANGSSPGQYYAITPLGAALLDQGLEQTTIPPMQGVYVVANENGAKIQLDYNKHVYKARTKDLNRPMRMPQEEDENFVRVRIQVNSASSGADRMYVIQYKNATRGYDNGYDAKNIIANGQANIYTNEMDGQMEISVADQIDSTFIGFAAGSDSEYTLTFTSIVGDDMYLHDLELDSMILIKDQEQYTFTVKPGSVNDMRFQLLSHSSPNEDQPNDGVATGMENLYSSAQIWVNNKRLYVTGAPQNSSLAIYSVSGLCIAAPSPLLQTPCIIDLSYLPTGIYVVRLNTQVFKFVCE